MKGTKVPISVPELKSKLLLRKIARPYDNLNQLFHIGFGFL